MSRETLLCLVSVTVRTFQNSDSSRNSFGPSNPDSSYVSIRQVPAGPTFQGAWALLGHQLPLPQPCGTSPIPHAQAGAGATPGHAPWQCPPARVRKAVRVTGRHQEQI